MSAEDLQIVSVIGANGQPLPLHGNSIGSNWSLPVKQERADEAEIQEMAAKFKEAQQAALAKQHQQQRQIANGMHGPLLPPTSNGQTNILNYLSRQQKLPNGTVSVNNNASLHNNTNGNGSSNGRPNGATSATTNGSSSNGDSKAPCDEESQKGKFGWTTFGKVHIPYIFRQQEKYCSVRMIEMKLLGTYLNHLHPDIYSSCTCVRSYYITEAEARLFIEINVKHCDNEFGRDMFTQKDLVVRLTDANKFYQFLDICYRKLMSGSKSPSEKCGFIRINKESVVPYTVRNNEQVVPLFYFEGETENLKQKADYLSGWDLAYLKFCCKVQGIRNELFSSENVAVISLTDIKSYFPNGTEFEDYWPSKVVDSNLLIGNRSNVNNSANWTRQPSQPPPKVIATSNISQKNSHSVAAVAAAAHHQQNMLKRNNASANAYAAQAAAMQQQGQRMHSNAALTQATVQALANGLNSPWMTQQPLLHAQLLQAQQQHMNNTRTQYRNPMENLVLGNRQSSYNAYNSAGISMQPVNSHSQSNPPPPLVRSAGGQNPNHMSNLEKTMLQQNQQTTQQQRHTNSLSSSSASSSCRNPINASATNAGPSSASSSPSTNPFNFNVLNPDYASLAVWQALTPEHRLLLTQQLKNSSAALLALGGGAPFPAPPSLPLDTDLRTMLDYNANKPKSSASSSSSSVSGAASSSRSPAGGQFTKPIAPAQMTQHSNDVERPPSRRTASSSSSFSAASAAAARSHYDNTASSSSATNNSCSSTVPLNSSTALEDFEKRFKMTEEMRAVVQKVLSNPDLSTFIQTNASSNFVPFISPPISPATNASGVGVGVGGASSTGQSAASNNAGPPLSLLNNPNVTITPQPPVHFPHGLSAALSTGAGVGNGGGGARQRSVICSTNVNGGAMNVPPSPSTSNSTATPSPSPTRFGVNGGPGVNANATSSSGSYASSHVNSKYPNHHLSHHQNFPHNKNQNTHHNHHNHNHHHNNNNQNTSSMEVIDLSSPRRSLQAASAYLQQQQQQAVSHQAAAVAAAQQQQQQQQQRLAAVAQHHAQHNGRSSGSSSTSSGSASLHLQRHAAMAAAAADNAQRLCIIPEIGNSQMNMQPYKLQKVYVENHLVPCINMKAYNDSEQLMTLTDFQKFFFPSVSLEHCKRLIEVLGVELYKGNRRQLEILIDNKRAPDENIPLVQVRDITKNMAQLNFMIRNQEQPPPKRTRVS